MSRSDACRGLDGNTELDGSVLGATGNGKSGRGTDQQPLVVAAGPGGVEARATTPTPSLPGRYPGKLGTDGVQSRGGARPYQP